MMLTTAFLPLLAALSFSLAAPTVPATLASLTFEDGTWGKWELQSGSTGNISVVAGGFNSAHAGAFHVNNRNGSLVVFSQTHSGLDPGQRYTWTADVKLNNPHCNVLFQNYAGILQSLGQGRTAAPNGTWVSYTSNYFSYKGEDTFNIAAFCDIPASSPLPKGPIAEFDNIVIKASGSQVYTNSTAPTGPNAVAQGNFQSGNLKAYHILTTGVDPSAKVVSPGYNGSAHAARVNITGAQSNPGVLELIQTLNGTKLNGVYKMSFAFKLLEPLSPFCAGQAYIQQAGYPDFASYIPYQLASQFPPDANHIPPVGQWVVYEGVVAGVGDGFQLGIELDCVFDNGLFEIGDISLVPLN